MHLQQSIDQEDKKVVTPAKNTKRDSIKSTMRFFADTVEGNSEEN